MLAQLLRGIKHRSGSGIARTGFTNTCGPISSRENLRRGIGVMPRDCQVISQRRKLTVGIDNCHIEAVKSICPSIRSIGSGKKLHFLDYRRLSQYLQSSFCLRNQRLIHCCAHTAGDGDIREVRRCPRCTHQSFSGTLHCPRPLAVDGHKFGR